MVAFTSPLLGFTTLPPGGTWRLYHPSRRRCKPQTPDLYDPGSPDPLPSAPRAHVLPLRVLPVGALGRCSIPSWMVWLVRGLVCTFFREGKKIKLIGCIGPPCRCGWYGREGGRCSQRSQEGLASIPGQGFPGQAFLAGVERILGVIACIGIRHRLGVPAHSALWLWALAGSWGCSLCGASSLSAT